MNRFLSILILGLLVSACGDGSADYAERMHDEHAGETPAASPMATGTEVDLTTETVTYFTGEGVSATGYLARPAGAEANLPGVIVIHEWWGLNDNIRSMTEKLAGEGYMALAVDLYGGQVAASSDSAMAFMQAALQNPELATANLKAAHAFLTEAGAPRVGSIGWCFGGAMSLRTAQALPAELDAAVIYYGQVTDDPDALRPLEMPILGIFGAEDRGIPVAGVEAFRDALEGLGKDAEIRIYEGAAHAFANPSGQAYQQEAAEDAWQRTTSFFAANLK